MKLSSAELDSKQAQWFRHLDSLNVHENDMDAISFRQRVLYAAAELIQRTQPEEREQVAYVLSRFSEHAGEPNTTVLTAAKMAASDLVNRD